MGASLDFSGSGELRGGSWLLRALLQANSEQLLGTLGNIERNVLFKALVRYTIKEDELKRPALMPVRLTVCAPASSFIARLAMASSVG